MRPALRTLGNCVALLLAMTLALVATHPAITGNSQRQSVSGSPRQKDRIVTSVSRSRTDTRLVARFGGSTGKSRIDASLRKVTVMVVDWRRLA